MPKPMPVPNADPVPGADVEPKIDGDPNADELEENREGEVLTPNACVVEPNSEEVVVDAVEPKGFEVVVPKGEDPNAEVDEDPKLGLLNTGVFGANGLDDEDEEKGLADD